MKKSLVAVFIILCFIVLTYSVWLNVFLNGIKSNVKCYIHTTPVVLHSLSEQYIVSDADRKYLCSYWGFSDDDFDEYRDHRNKYRIAEISLTIINDSGMELHMPRIVPSQNAKYWFSESSICECSDHTIPAYSKKTITVNALVRIADELCPSPRINAADFLLELHFDVDFRFFKLRTCIQSLPSI